MTVKAKETSCTALDYLCTYILWILMCIINAKIISDVRYS